LPLFNDFLQYLFKYKNPYTNMSTQKRRRGRPRKYEKTVPFTLYLSSILKERLREISLKTGKSMNELVLDALVFYLLEYLNKLEGKNIESTSFLSLRIPTKLMVCLKEVKEEVRIPISELIREAILMYYGKYYEGG